MVHHHRTRFRGADGVGERESGIVGGGIEVARAADKAVAAQRRLPGGDLARAQPTVGADVAKERERVVQRKTGGELPSRHARPDVHRPDELQRADKVRREPKETPPLGARLEH